MQNCQKTNMDIKEITIGTRGSPLALIQTEMIRKKLLKVRSGLKIIVKIIKTEGDINLSSIPLDTVGKSWFTENIENEILDGSIDIAVHSLKDLPMTLPRGLMLGAICEREDPADVLVTQKARSFLSLPRGARVGTDSLRRRAQLLADRPDLQVKSLRGNIATRLRKLDEGEYDAIVLAAAGLSRLGLKDRIIEYFSPNDFVPAPGQGALAIEVSEKNFHARALLSEISNNEARVTTEAEREFSYHVDGGCKNPVGAFGYLDGTKLILTGMIASSDGKYLHKDTIEGLAKDSRVLGKSLAARMLVTCSWYQPSFIYEQ